MFKPLRFLLLSLSMILGGHALAQVSEQPAPAAPAAPAASATGTLVVDVKAFTSEKKLPKKVVKQLESGMLEWGVQDRQLVFTMVNRRFINFPIDKTTRFGERSELSLPAGEYRITGIGLEFSTAFSPEALLNKGAYINQDIVVFTIEPGKTTTLSILPQIMIDRTFAVNFWVPSLMTSVVDEAGTATTPVALNDRYETSITWPNYNGPLKFVPKNHPGQVSGVQSIAPRNHHRFAATLSPCRTPAARPRRRRGRYRPGRSRRRGSSAPAGSRVAAGSRA